MQMFPTEGISQADVDEFNQQANYELQHIRDFIILHYHVTQRRDAPYWRDAAQMEIPASLRHRIALFRDVGRVFRISSELFAENSWIQVMLGQGLMPRSHHQTADLMGDAELSGFLRSISDPIANMVRQLPTHQAYVERYCPAKKSDW